jgi:hypothetical protein
MPYVAPTVNYSATFNGTYTTLTGVQSVNIFRGRRRFQDPYSGTTCQIELIPATSYATPLAVGQFIDVRTTNAAASPAYFTGRISDVERIYGMPYNTGTQYAPQDRIVITAQGTIGAIGQAGNAGFDYLFDLDIVSMFSRVAGECGMGFDTNLSPFGVQGALLDAATDSESFLDVLNKMCNAAQTLLEDVDMHRDPVGSIGTADFWWQVFQPPSTRAITFSDAPGVNEYAFNQIKYLSGAEMTFTQVQVNGYVSSLAPQIANTGSAPYNTLVYDTKLKTTAAMSNLANYLLIVNSQNTPTPFSLTTDTLCADGIQALLYMTDENSFLPYGTKNYLLGTGVTIEFRGTTVTALLQGISSNFYADRAVFELMLSPSLGVPFTLDSTSFGVLDQNRLGF